MERARAQRPTITCAHCGGHDFVVAIVNLRGNSELQCVKYAEHVEQLGLAEKRRQYKPERGTDPDLA
jgi:hypothetical protein